MPGGSRAPPFSRCRCRWLPASDRPRRRLGRPARTAFGQPDPDPYPAPAPDPAPDPRPAPRLRAGKRRCLRGRFLGARPAGEPGAARRASGAGAALLPSPKPRSFPGAQQRPEPAGPCPAGPRSRRSSRTAQSPDPPGSQPRYRPADAPAPSPPHSPGPVALPAPLLSLLVPVAGGGGGAAPGSCAGCGAAEPPLAPSLPGPPAPPPRPARLPGPDVTQAPPSALRRRGAGPGRAGRIRASPRPRAQRRRWRPPAAEGAGGRRKDKSRRRRRGGGLGSQRKTEVSEDGRGLSAPAQGAPCSARLGRGAQVTVAEVSRAGPVAVLAPGVKRDRQSIGRGLGFLF